MRVQTFHYAILGQPSLDIDVDYDGTTLRHFGGAVVYGTFTACALGMRSAAVPKGPWREDPLDAIFAGAKAQLFPVESPTRTSISNVYRDADRETRHSRAISRIEPYALEDLPPIRAQVWHLAGLMAGDIPAEVIQRLAAEGDVGLDLQGVMRQVAPDGSMRLCDWPDKERLLPRIRFLKADAAEAAAITGQPDRYEAARILCGMGAREVMITHNSEVLIYDAERFYVQPIRSRNLSGRTGRGDTAFSAYLCMRLNHSIPEALMWATALVSLKMETPGPFRGTAEDVQAFIQQYFQPEQRP